MIPDNYLHGLLSSWSFEMIDFGYHRSYDSGGTDT
jgi:hypothetical protein